ncbi:unnamed protein product [Phytophthora lilii]|uniref:Unnamed protein product n=1 Tax=Phytophthora lilii TaxID=2077276 RepID=A0A9W6U101_9STRA|nr:unnamed protein product [Phytophthora lilii]
MQCFEEVPGDTISKEAFVCILALFYDRLAWRGGASNNGEGFIAEKDYLYLLNYLEEYMPLPKQLYAAFEECMIPMAGLLSNSQFVTWVRQYPDVMEVGSIDAFAVVKSMAVQLDLFVQVTSFCPARKNDPNRNPFRSFDFIGGEDSGDEDSDGLYDSDQITEMEMSQSSFRDSTTSLNGHDELTSILKEAGAVVQDDSGERSSDLSVSSQRTDGAPLPVSVRDPFYPPDDSVAPSSRRGQGRSGGSRSRGVQKMGRYMGKAVGGGISRVGHVGRSILHVGKSQGYNQHDHHNDDPAALELLSAGYSFSSESQSTKKYVCGYLHKISDSKWGKKRSWHRRWFVLDRQRGVLSYYRHNPANHMPTSSSHGNIVHMADSPVPTGKSLAATSSDQPVETKRQSCGSPTKVPSAPGSSSGEIENRSSESADSVGGVAVEAKEAESAVRSATTIEEPINTGKQQQDQDQLQEQQQTLLYLNEAHPWYRGALDLNMDNVSLLFEKTLARNAPTRYFFQVSTLSLHDIDSKRGVQYKTDFDLWTSAIAEAINRKDSQNGKANSGAPVLSHQQLYRQRLLQKQMEEQAAQARELETGFDSGHDTPPPTLGRPSLDQNSPAEEGRALRNAASSSYPKRKIPPRIVTQFPSVSDSGGAASSCWHLHIHVDGTKQCLIVGFMLNIVAIRCLASEHVLWKIAVCLAVTCMFVFSVYNPRPLTRPRQSSYGGYADSHTNLDNTLLATDISQCSNPENCCLHKASSTVSSERGESNGNSGANSTDVPRRRSSGVGNGRIVKFPMGSTMAQCEMQASGRSSNVEHSWTTTRAETFSVRSAEPALFEFINADLVKTDSKLDLVSERVEFPPEYENSRLFIINAQELKNPTTTTLKLFKRFLEAGNDTSLTDRFKVIAQVTNQDECGITGMGKKLLVSHNATPVLTRPQHRIYHFRDGTTEIVVDVHAFSYIARRGIHSLIDKTSRLVIDVAFVIQGETEEELPEQVLGCCRLDRVNVQKAVDLPC